MYGKTLADYPERFEQFFEEFRGSDPEVLDKAFASARSGIREFPTPADIRRLYGNEILSVPTEILEREDKPPDWAAIGKKSGIAPEEIQEWLQAGKEAQLEHIAKLEDDPKWRAEAQKLGGFPGLQKREPVETMTAEERKSWATKKAQEQEWL